MAAVSLEDLITDLIGNGKSRKIRCYQQKLLCTPFWQIKHIVLETPTAAKFLMYAVSERRLKPGEDYVSLQYIADLAGFYNARYFFEVARYESLKFPIGQFDFFKKSLIVGAKEFTVFVSKLHKTHLEGPVLDSDGHPRSKHYRRLSISIDEAYIVADKLAYLHQHTLHLANDKDIRTIVQENYSLVAELISAKLIDNINDYLAATLEDSGEFFTSPDACFEKICFLYKTFSKLSEAYPTTPELPLVLTHGNLTAEKMLFTPRKNDLQLIEHWETVHFGSAAEDLVHLIITSLSVSDRRSSYLKILRKYYYSLRDARTVCFKLKHLKSFYLKYLKYSVFLSFSTLAAVLKSKAYTKTEKKAAVDRFEAAVEDAYQVEMGTYDSDDEDLLTAQNTEHRHVAAVVANSRKSFEPCLSPIFSDEGKI